MLSHFRSLGDKALTANAPDSSQADDSLGHQVRDATKQIANPRLNYRGRSRGEAAVHITERRVVDERAENSDRCDAQPQCAVGPEASLLVNFVLWLLHAT